MQSFYENQMQLTQLRGWIVFHLENHWCSILMLGEHAQKNEVNTKSVLYPKTKKKNLQFLLMPPAFY